MPKILVTGGTGYIGSHTIVELLQNNFEVLTIDNLSNSSIQSLEGIEKITGKKVDFELLDLCEKQKVSDYFKKHIDIDAVIHFAANKSVGESFENPLKYYGNNISSMVNLIDAIANYNKNIKLVFSSSCTVYGYPNYLPIDELHPFNGYLSPYGRTKQICENIIQDTLKISNNFTAISLRYFNPIGAHNSGFIGESPKILYNLMPILTETANGKREKIMVYGNDYDTPDGTCVRDYIHVVDLAKAHISAVKRLLNNEQKNSYEFFNLGVGKGFSVLDIIKTFEKVTQKYIKFEFAQKRKGDIAAIFADPSLALKELNWKTELSLDDMLLSSWLWESEKRFY